MLCPVMLAVSCATDPRSNQPGTGAMVHSTISKANMKQGIVDYYRTYDGELVIAGLANPWAMYRKKVEKVLGSPVAELPVDAKKAVHWTCVFTACPSRGPVSASALAVHDFDVTRALYKKEWIALEYADRDNSIKIPYCNIGGTWWPAVITLNAEVPEGR